MTGTDIIVSLASLGSGAGEGLVGFEGEVGGGQRRATTRLLDGEFPKVRQIIPNDDSIETRVRIDTAHLVEAVKRVALVAERNAPVRLTFTEDGVTLDAGSGDEAQASESLEAKVTGSDGRMPNSRFCMRRVSSIAPAAPIRMPTPARTRACLTTIESTVPRCAPSAIRIPISCVRCVTA